MLGSFALIKNEAPWVGFCILAAQELIDEWVFFDGNSTDGTIEILEYLRDKRGLNIKLFKGQDPKDLRDDYAHLFNQCLKQVKSPYAWFLHPDMILTHGEKECIHSGPLCYSVEHCSFAGNPGEKILEFWEGRASRWKSIMRNSLGLHYHGPYGGADEDLYFEKITADEYILHQDWSKYPFDIVKSGIRIAHFSDVRPYERRLGRMKTCLLNQGHDAVSVERLAKDHPRVSLKSGKTQFGEFTFSNAGPMPKVFAQYATELAQIVGKRPEEFCPVPLEVIANAAT